MTNPQEPGTVPEGSDKVASGKHQKKRKREAENIGGDVRPLSREGSSERVTPVKQKNHAPGDIGCAVSRSRESFTESVTAGKQSAPGTEAEARDVRKQDGEDRGGDPRKGPKSSDLPGLKQKRRLLYGQLQDARQQVCTFRVSDSANDGFRVLSTLAVSCTLTLL